MTTDFTTAEKKVSQKKKGGCATVQRSATLARKRPAPRAANRAVKRGVEGPEVRELRSNWLKKGENQKKEMQTVKKCGETSRAVHGKDGMARSGRNEPRNGQ